MFETGFYSLKRAFAGRAYQGAALLDDPVEVAREVAHVGVEAYHEHHDAHDHRHGKAQREDVELRGGAGHDA